MKIKYLLFVVAFISSVFIGCSDNIIGINNVDKNAMENKRQTFEMPKSQMNINIIYVYFGNAEGYSDGAILYKNRRGQIKTDMPSTAYFLNQKEYKDSVIVRVRYLDRTFNMKFFLTPFKLSEIPARDSLHPYDGFSIVGSIKSCFVYRQSENKITIFNQNNTTESLSTTQQGYVVSIPGNRELRPHDVIPFPWQNNVHRFIDHQSVYYTYLVDSQYFSQ